MQQCEHMVDQLEDYRIPEVTEVPAIPTTRVILDQMLDLINFDDTETAHGNADDLLIELIKILGKDNPEIDKVITAYNNIPKWYA